MLSTVFCSSDRLSGAYQPLIFAEGRTALKNQQPKKVLLDSLHRFPTELVQVCVLYTAHAFCPLLFIICQFRA